jgi:hypothetical protein
MVKGKLKPGLFASPVDDTSPELSRALGAIITATAVESFPRRQKPFV